MSDKRRLVYSILKFISSGRNLSQKWRIIIRHHLYSSSFTSLRRRPPPYLLYPIFIDYPPSVLRAHIAHFFGSSVTPVLKDGNTASNTWAN